MDDERGAVGVAALARVRFARITERDPRNRKGLRPPGNAPFHSHVGDTTPSSQCTEKLSTESSQNAVETVALPFRADRPEYTLRRPIPRPEDDRFENPTRRGAPARGLRRERGSPLPSVSAPPRATRA